MNDVNDYDEHDEDEDNDDIGGMSALIVDDVHILRIVIKDILIRYCGFNPKNVYEASDGTIAVRDYKRLQPDIVFLDVLMPHMDGKETVKRLIEIDPEAYIIMCSSAAEKSIVKSCIGLGARDYVLKPLDPKRVELSIEKFNDADPLPVRNEEPEAAPEPAEDDKAAAVIEGKDGEYEIVQKK